MTDNNQSQKMTRREFFKGTAAGVVGGLVLGVGGTSLATGGKQDSGLPEKWDYEVDVLSIGAGATGLMAALWAKDAGAEVMILEKSATLFGSATSICGGGWVVGGGTSTQKEQGIEDTPEKFYDYLISHSKVPSDPVLVQKFVDTSSEVYEWVLTLGVECVSLAAYWGMEVPRCHWTDTVKTIQLLDQECQKQGVEILYETPATRLITNADGRVVGAEADSNGSTIYVKARKGVVLGCGGFSANPDMLYDFHGPTVAKMMPVGSPNDTGDGYKMALSTGAALKDVFVMPDMAVAALDSRITLAQIPRDGGIMVNKNGKRFVDESALCMTQGPAAAEQPDGLAYIIYDANVPKQMSNIKLERHNKANGDIYQADTIAELAEMAGLPVDTVVETVENYNGYVDAGEDPECGRVTLDGPDGVPVRLETAPFYCIPCTGAIYPTEIGLQIDENSRVIDMQGNVIPGLYAGGLMAAMGVKSVSGRTLPAMAGAYTFGYIAGKHAAQQESWEA